MIFCHLKENKLLKTCDNIYNFKGRILNFSHSFLLNVASLRKKSNNMEFLESEILENKVNDILWFIGILVVGLLLKRLLSVSLSKVLYRFIKHDKVSIHTCVDMLRKPVELFIVLLMVYIAFLYLHFPVSWNLASRETFGLKMILMKCFQCFLIFSISWIVIRLVKFIALIFQERAALTETKLDDQFVPFFKDLAIVMVAILTFFAMLGIVFRIDVVALVTGLGIGGLAIALAAKETLENLFASLMLFMDLPFVVGDNIQLDKVSGDVEKIGFRSTRLKTVDGSVVTVPNRLLTAQALENMSTRQFRRAKYLIKLQQDTPVSTIQNIVNQIQEEVLAHEHIYKPDPGVTRFEGVNDSSLDIQVAYNVESNNVAILNKTREEINYKIVNIVQNNGAKFADLNNRT